MGSCYLYKRIVRKFRKISNPYIGPIRRKKLNNLDFTIFSNNCWGGICYEYFSLQKRSPTVGMYFFANEYIKFLNNIESYLSYDLEFASVNESKYKEELLRRRQGNRLIGMLNDVEIIFLHYNDKIVAKDKWNRRVDRINWNNLIFKFSFMDLCSKEHIVQFENIMHEKINKSTFNQNIRSIVFVPTRDLANRYNDAYFVKSDSSGQIADDTFFWNKYCDIYKVLNI